MNTDDQLSELLRDAVADVEPTDRLVAIRARTATPQRAAARPWFYAAAGTVLATAAAVGAFAVLDGEDADHHDHLATAPDTQVVPVYYLADAPGGPRLFREFDEVPAGDPVQAALDRVERPARDPDYRTPWTEGSFGGVTVDADSIDVELRVNDLSDELAVQQVVYTLQAAAGERLPVWFWLAGQRGNAPYVAAPQDDVLSPVSISDPAEGNSYAGSLIARGRATSPTGTATWAIRQGDEVAERGSVTVGTDALAAWEVSIDLSGVAPGTYTFEVTQDSPPDAYFLPTTDTRTITVR